MLKKPSYTTKTVAHDASPGSRTRRFASLLLMGTAAMGIMFFTLSSMALGAMHDDLAVDPKAVALANAVTASPPGIMSIHYNPAGLSTLSEGHSFNIGLSYQSLDIERSFASDPEYFSFIDAFETIDMFKKEGHDPVAGKTSKNSDTQMAIPFSNNTVDYILSPSLGIANRKKGSKWTFGLGGGYLPYAWGFNHDDPDDPSRFGAKSMYSQHAVLAAPAVSYRFTPSFSMGVSVGLGQSSLGAEQEFRINNTLSGLTHITGVLTGYVGMAQDQLMALIPTLLPPDILAALVPLMGLQQTMDMIIPPMPFFAGGIYPYYSQSTFEYDMKDNFSPNYNVGMLWDAFSWLSLGLCYRSEIKQEFTGNYSFNYSQDFQNFVDWYGSNELMQLISTIFSLPTESLTGQNGTVTQDTKLPQSAQGGIKVSPFSWLRLTSDLKWTNWSVIKEDRLVFDQNIQLIRFMNLLGVFDPDSNPEDFFFGTSNVMTIERHFKDTYDWSVGAEIDPFRWLTLRFGYEARQSCVEDEFFDLMYAFPDTDNYGAGFEIHFADGLHLAVGLSYMVGKEYEVNYTQSKNLNSGSEALTPYNGLDIKQDTTEAYTVSVAFHGTTDALGEGLSRLGAWWNRFYKPY